MRTSGTPSFETTYAGRALLEQLALERLERARAVLEDAARPACRGRSVQEGRGAARSA